MNQEKSKEISELRQDPVSHDWIIISTGRTKKPSHFRSRSISSQEMPINLCPFENLKEHSNEIVKIYYNKNNKPTINIIKNKFPIVDGNVCNTEKRVGPYLVKESAGYHEVVIFKDHKKSIAELEAADVMELVGVYLDRYQDLKNKECANYVLIMHNHGEEAGASVSHPHSQILALPFIPPDVQRSLDGSKKYKKERGRCAHCDVIEWELKEKKRVIFENENFVVFAPYTPKFSYELRVFPKKHNAYFEEASLSDLKGLAEALKVSLTKIYNGLGNPAYNFFMHTFPVDGEGIYDSCSYHWHLEIIPRMGVWGGLELGTGSDVINIDPDEVAEYLRGIKT